MMSSDFIELESMTECEFTRSNIIKENLESLHMAADSVFYRYNLRLDELNDRFCEYIMEIREIKGLLERIALVVGKTYSERGDAYQLADDVALMQIRDLLLQHDPDILCFNKEQKMSRLHERQRRCVQEWLTNHRLEDDDDM